MDDDSDMTPVNHAVEPTPAVASSNSKKQAVPGPTRANYDAMQDQIAYLQASLLQEKRRRRELEAKHGDVEALRDETVQYVAEYEIKCAEHFGREALQLRGQLDETEKQVEETATALDHEKQKTAEMGAQLAAQQTEHEKQNAEKTTEILAMMSKLRPSQPFAPAVDRDFPQNLPRMLPQFISPGTRRSRALERVIKTSNGRIPVVPLRPASPSGSAGVSTEIPVQVMNYDGQHEDDISFITDLIKKIMSDMGIESAAMSRKQKKKKRAHTKLSLEVKSQQSLMEKEDDLLYKRGLREVWRKTHALSIANDFKSYQPIPLERVEACNNGEGGPEPGEYTLDFSEGYLTSLWNKKVINKLTQSFLAAHTTSSHGWGLPQVTTEYVQGEFYGQLKRSQQAWAQWRPRYIFNLNRMETEAEVRARVEAYQGDRQERVNTRSSKKAKLDRRTKTVEKVVAIKTLSQAPDLQFWLLLKKILAYLDIGGMSSEDSGVRDQDGLTVNVYYVRLCAWRASTITDYVRIVDDTAKKMKTGVNRAMPRIREKDAQVGRSGPPTGLPKKMYDEKWLADRVKKNPDYEEELEVSKEAFEFMVAATSSLVP
ncbi:hypothetical protein B0H11DRAFT_2295394 [Mycena galericulata]|nr:hypothetical protein B0H11DRAFT_2295394 [Mycena galericulata]